VLPDPPKRIDSSNPGEPDSEDSSSDSGSDEDVSPLALDQELKKLYEGKGKPV